MTPRPTVLVVEDDLFVRQPLEKFLALSGFDVIAADSADGAVSRLSAQPVQAAVVDLRLTRGSGRDVVAFIPPPIPVIIFSGVPDQSARLEHLRPNTRLILKPFSLLMLVETLQRMLDATSQKNPPTRKRRTKRTQ